MQVPFLLFSRKLPVATAEHGAKARSAMIPSASIMADSELLIHSRIWVLQSPLSTGKNEQPYRSGRDLVIAINSIIIIILVFVFVLLFIILIVVVVEGQ
jgi:hypothetical protein